MGVNKIHGNISQTPSPSSGIGEVGDNRDLKCNPSTPGVHVEPSSDNPKALAEIIGNSVPKLSSYFTGAPCWTPEASRRLHGFVVKTLGDNPAFEGKPRVLEEVAQAVTEAIKSSPQLTARFLPYLTQ
jgi:hypothetical protein